MATLEPAGLLLGRCLLAALFLHEGWAKLTGYDGAARYAEAFGVPAALLPGALVLELGGGLLLVAGLGTRIAALALAAFCVAAALVFHTRFGDRNQLLHFEKDIALAGGFLILALRGAGAWALDPLLDAWRTDGQTAARTARRLDP